MKFQLNISLLSETFPNRFTAGFCGEEDMRSETAPRGWLQLVEHATASSVVSVVIFVRVGWGINLGLPPPMSAQSFLQNSF